MQQLEERFRRVTSRQNSAVKGLRQAFHDAIPNDRGLIAVEGFHLVEEAIRSGLRIETVFFSEAAMPRAHKLLPQLSSHTELLLLPDAIFASSAPTETPQGVAALVLRKLFGFEDVLRPAPSLLVIVAGLQDPGNLGTIARSAEAFGATGIILGEKTVSPWNWKALRASAGSLFRLPSVRLELQAAIPDLKTHGVRVLATSSHKGNHISHTDLRGPVALVVGNEGAGVPRDVLAQADEVVVIPQSAHVESLNAGIAASVILYEAARQRSNLLLRHGDSEG